MKRRSVALANFHGSLRVILRSRIIVSYSRRATTPRRSRPLTTRLNHATSSRETFLGYGLGRLCRNETRRLVASTTVMLAPRSVLITSREDLFHRGRHPIASHSPRLASSIIADCEEKELLGRKEGRKHCCKSLVIGFRELKIHIRKICGKTSTSRIKFCWGKL